MDIQNFLDRPEVSGIFFAICIVIALVVTFSFANSVVERTNWDGLKSFLKCFSIYDSVVSIYNTNSSPNSINSINGIRSLICLWVLLIHCGYFTMYAYDNLPALMATLERIEIQPIFAIVFYVDVFFVLSALLLVYNFLKDERTLTEVRNNTNIGNAKLFVKKIIHRYIRLTPAFIFTVGLGHILSVYIQQSTSFHIDETFDAYCPQNALWNSVFYIHNLFEVKDMCLAWSWYLACDMQFYIIILFILFVYARNPATAKVMFVALCAVLTSVLIYLDVDMNVLPRLDSIFDHLDEFYIEPWNRMHPYLAGCTVGYIMFQIKGKKFSENRYITLSYWTVTAATIVGSLFLTSFKESTALNFALALSVGRYVMGVFAGSWVVMCHIGYGGIVNTILSSRFFVHLNKVSYIMYLIHPILILFFNSTQESSPHFDLPSLALSIFGIMLLSYVAAVILSPIFELPFQKLSDEYVMKKSKTKKH
ncbi:nose resistant to fluoxetine protein 6-like [Bradysia coprophila]|uniref:nose resistant to fluoxetine protein 6-like n=1 Tax=Bradysia coprophila TaxID=38358 RepID=UPI00187DD8A9|nr:nose resistant to fluoxetine protein 6-like [Bradysia coprophila]